MAKQIDIKKNAYFDSVTLMSLAGKVQQMDGVQEAIVSMATAMNKELARDIGLGTDEVEQATDNDLLLGVVADNDEAMEAAFSRIQEAFEAKKSTAKTAQEKVYTQAKSAFFDHEDANLAIISTAGEYAAREANLALERGLHVMIFSDNVSVEDERSLKEKGKEKGLFVMGPDCGTAIVNGTGLCFANDVKKGPIGLVGASGTGLQEVTVQIDRLGEGVSQAIGTGGRDLSEAIGGLMMLQAFEALENDPATEVIVLISKPPSPSVQEKILKQVKASTKPVVISFIDGDEQAVTEAGAVFGHNLADTAQKAVQLAKGEEVSTTSAGISLSGAWQEQIRQAQAGYSPGQTAIRALYGGGTLCAEALSIMRQGGQKVTSNVAKRPEEKLHDLKKSEGHVLLDLGEDEFTVGKPHPMIDPATRNQRMLQEAGDKETAVILLDMELGYGSHEDPVGAALPFIQQAFDKRPGLTVVAYVCGTETDPQGLQDSEERLRQANVLVANSNVEAVHLALECAGVKEVSA